ncbi:MAG TPA: thiamine phosphate synthase [Candidatus Cybelea sp.]|jgi:thiamine-phosphate pyrophosphorylase|nr:thiamine phosphate synthase [Candidatus Cybelea sp.]
MATHASSRVTRAGRAELLHGIYVILDEGTQTIALARAVLDAGVRIVQYRAKNGIRSACARALRELTRERDSLLILNDDWRAALLYDCDGVHLGPGDDGFAATASVRNAMQDRLIGLSCGTAVEIRDAGTRDVDYLGVGPVFETLSKSDAGRALGTDELRRLSSASTLPVAAIGGISVARVGGIRRCGVAMAAVISAVSSAVDPRATAAALVDGWNSGG